MGSSSQLGLGCLISAGFCLYSLRGCPTPVKVLVSIEHLCIAVQKINVIT